MPENLKRENSSLVVHGHFFFLLEIKLQYVANPVTRIFSPNPVTHWIYLDGGFPSPCDWRIVSWFHFCLMNFEDVCLFQKKKKYYKVKRWNNFLHWVWSVRTWILYSKWTFLPWTASSLTLDPNTITSSGTLTPILWKYQPKKKGCNAWALRGKFGVSGVQLQYGNRNTTLSNTLNYKLNLYEEEMKCF